jgi:hypothetical protein
MWSRRPSQPLHALSNGATRDDNDPVSLGLELGKLGCKASNGNRINAASVICHKA